MPKIDGFLSLTVSKIELGKSYPMSYGSDDSHPVDKQSYEWFDDWFLEYTPEDSLQNFIHGNELKAIKDGYIVLEYSVVSNHPSCPIEEDVDNLGIGEVIEMYQDEIKTVYEESLGWDNQLPEKTILLAFSSDLSQDL